jgi:hypothetical protein
MQTIELNGNQRGNNVGQWLRRGVRQNIITKLANKKGGMGLFVGRREEKMEEVFFVVKEMDNHSTHLMTNE